MDACVAGCTLMRSVRAARDLLRSGIEALGRPPDVAVEAALAPLGPDQERAVAARYAALRATETAGDLAAAVAGWRRLLEETGDTEELARLRERLIARLSGPVSLADLPGQAAEALARWRMDATAAIGAWLVDWAMSWPVERRVALSGRWAWATIDGGALDLAVGEAHRLLDQAWRSAGEDRYRRALPRIALCAETIRDRYDLEPTANIGDALRRLVDQLEDADPELVTEQVAARTAVADALVAAGDRGSAKRVLTGESGPGVRVAALVGVASQAALRPLPRAVDDLRWLLAEAPAGEASEQIALLLAPLLARSGAVAETDDLIYRIHPPAARLRARCRVAAALAPDEGRALWRTAGEAVELATLEPEAVAEWVAVGLSLAASSERVEAVWPELRRRLADVDPFDVEPIWAAACGPLAEGGEGGLGEALRLVGRLTRPGPRCRGLTAIGVGRLRLGDRRGRADLRAALRLALDRHRSGDVQWDAWSAWCEAVAGLADSDWAEMAAEGWAACGESWSMPAWLWCELALIRRVREQVRAAVNRAAAAMRAALLAKLRVAERRC